MLNWNSGSTFVYTLGWLQTTVNKFLEDLDTTGVIGGTLNISGDNAAPDWGTEESPSTTALAYISLASTLKSWALTVTGTVPQWVMIYKYCFFATFLIW
jgi:hypothetical protein